MRLREYRIWAPIFGASPFSSSSPRRFLFSALRDSLLFVLLFLYFHSISALDFSERREEEAV